eukprot:COSAG06_NODE_4892_length_3877_cov_17.052938_3_plen_651_part_00
MYIRHGGLLPPRATWAHQRRFEREWAKEREKKCAEAEMEKVLEDQRRGLFYDGRVANQKRKKEAYMQKCRDNLDFGKKLEHETIQGDTVEKQLDDMKCKLIEKGHVVENQIEALAGAGNHKGDIKTKNLGGGADGQKVHYCYLCQEWTHGKWGNHRHAKVDSLLVYALYLLRTNDHEKLVPDVLKAGGEVETDSEEEDEQEADVVAAGARATQLEQLQSAIKDQLSELLEEVQTGTSGIEVEPYKAFAMAAASAYETAIKHAPDPLRADDLFVKRAVNRKGTNLQYVAEVLQADEAVVRIAVSKDGDALQFASEGLQSNTEVAMLAVQKTPLAIQWASTGVRADETVVLAAVSQDGTALQWASEALRNKKEIVQVAFETSGRECLQWASTGVRGDELYMLTVVKKDGFALEYALAELQGNEAVAKAAVTENGSALQFASAELQDNEAVVKAALAAADSCLSPLRFASIALRSNSEIIQLAIEKDGCALEFAMGTLANDKLIVEKAVEMQPKALQYASEDLRNDSGIVEKAVTKDGASLQWASEDLRGSEKIVLLALQQYAKHGYDTPPRYPTRLGLGSTRPWQPSGGEQCESFCGFSMYTVPRRSSTTLELDTVGASIFLLAFASTLRFLAITLTPVSRLCATNTHSLEE